MPTRRTLLKLAAGAPLLALPVSCAAAAEVGDNGLHVQPWFVDSFLDLREDLDTAAGAGKNFAVLFEQRGCPYCREMHTVNLAIPEISGYVRENFDVLQLDMWGSRKVTDFDGEELEERELAQKWRVQFTPTISYFPQNLSGGNGKSGRDLEAARMPGYFKPFHFVSMFEYVRDGAYADQPFQRFLQAKFKRLEEEGKKPEIW